jgi:hypothetical protein
MGRFMSRLPKNFLPLAHLTGGFTLMAVGFGIIFGLGVGLIAAGALWVTAQTVAYSSERGSDGQDPAGPPPQRLP